MERGKEGINPRGGVTLLSLKRKGNQCEQQEQQHFFHGSGLN
jgi:hypothetical protein